MYYCASRKEYELKTLRRLYTPPILSLRMVSANSSETALHRPLQQAMPTDVVGDAVPDGTLDAGLVLVNCYANIYWMLLQEYVRWSNASLILGDHITLSGTKGHGTSLMSFVSQCIIMLE